MKKKQYLKPDIEVTSILPLRLMGASPGWSQDGNPPIDVEEEDDDWEGNDDDGYGGFLDLD